MNKMTSKEMEVCDYYQALGWDVVKPSWPDLIMINQQTKEIQMVEVKGHGDRMSLEQGKSFRWLQKAGFTVKVVFLAPWFKEPIRERLFTDSLSISSVRRKRRFPLVEKKEKKGEWGDFLKSGVSTIAPYLSWKDPFKIDE